MKKLVISTLMLLFFLNLNVILTKADEIDWLNVPWEYDDIYERLEQNESINLYSTNTCHYEPGILYYEILGNYPYAGKLAERMYDCNLNTSYSFPTRLTIDLGDTYVINKIFGAAGNMVGAYGQWYVEFLTENDDVILRTETLSSKAGKIKLFESPVQGVSKIRIVRNSGQAQQARVAALEIYGVKESEIPNYFNYPVKNVKASVNGTSVTLTWDNPIDEMFHHVNIYKDGEFIKRIDNNRNEVTLEEHEFLKSYTYELRAADAYYNESEGVFITVQIPFTEVKNLKAIPSYNRVNLSWLNPSFEGFSHVTIYRKDNEKEDNLFMKFLLGAVVHARDYVPIFETNGTYFNDLTVNPETRYEYRLTTTTEDGIESEGVTIQVTTPKEPLPQTGGEELEEDENGDFLVKWTSPTTGQVKILIDGAEYAVVDANLQQYLIPKNDMVYDFWGNPKIQLIAVSEDGKEGNPKAPPIGGGGISTGTKMPFKASDLLSTVMSLIWLLGPLFLLSLAVFFFKPIVNVIRKAVRNKKWRY